MKITRRKTSAIGGSAFGGKTQNLKSMDIKRHKTKVIKIGNLYIGGNNPIAIQSMTKTRTADIEQTVKQIRELGCLGAEIVRLAVKDNQDALALKKIKARVKTPLVADIHFNWLFAIKAIESGLDKIRLNPGNIYKREQIHQIARAAKLNHIPIRVGVNSGSLRSRGFSSEKMVKSALGYIKILEKFGFYDIVVSLKASNISDTIEAYRRMSKLCDYPLHLGVTACGPLNAGTVKSSIVIGSLLTDGIGDTIRISLTDSPSQEVRVAKLILEALGLRRFGAEIISCPTCGRCEVDLVKLVNDLDGRLPSLPLKIAMMGCMVNGPGEAKEADIGIAFGKKEGLLFRKSRLIKKIPFSRSINCLLKEMRRMHA